MLKDESPLEKVDGLDDKQISKLRALSVTTAEQLLGLVAADPEAVREFLGVDIPQVQADAARVSNPKITRSLREVDTRPFAMGAVPPSDAVVEQRAEQSTFEDYFGTALSEQAGGPPTEEVLHLDCFDGVRDQGVRGTCVAYACCALLECHVRRKTGTGIDFSEQFLYWAAKERDGRPDQEGTYVDIALDAATAEGVCLETVWPYNPVPDPGNESQGPPPTDASQDASGRRAPARRKLDPRSSQEIRDTLDRGSLVAISVPVYKNWYDNPYVRESGSIQMPLPTSSLEGGHAMCAVGYGFSPSVAGGGYLILRNSWGTSWAFASEIQAGYGTIPFLYVDRYGWEAFTLDDAATAT